MKSLNIEACKRCGEYLDEYMDCFCQAYKVKGPDGEVHTIHAINSHYAALAFAKQINIENSLVKSSEKITVDGYGYLIRAEMIVKYEALAI